MRCLTIEIDRLLREGRHTVWNLPHLDYTQDVVEHWLRYYWPVLLSIHENGEMSGSDLENDYHLIYLDLTCAIAKLPPREKRMATMLTEGYHPYGADGIEGILRISEGEARALMRRTCRMISEKLRG